MKQQPGSYAVILENRKQATIDVGRRIQLAIEPGYYLYVGSAFGPGGLRARVGRHARPDKKRRWHIDFIRAHMDFQYAWCSYSPVNQEHCWAGLLQTQMSYKALPGIGCSDCRCETHLFYSPRQPDLRAFNNLLIEPVDCWRAEAIFNDHAVSSESIDH